MAITKNGIVYPDSYDEVADVPADLKKMAESVDKNIEQIQENIKDKNKEQDAKIENNINSINEIKQENINIKAENQRLRNDIESSQLVEEASGEFIDLSDCSNARFNKFKIGGNHKQETSPSSEYPSEIKAVKDNITAKIVNKNIFNKNDANVMNAYFAGNTLTALDTTRTLYFKIKPNTNYVVSKVKSARFDVATTKNVPVVGLVVENKISKSNDTNISIKSGSDDNYIIVYFNKNDVDTLTEQEILNSIQVEEDTIATTRIEHQEQTFIMPVQQEMLQGDYFDWDNEKEYHEWNKIVLKGDENWKLQNSGNRFDLISPSINAKTVTSDKIGELYCTHFIRTSANKTWNAITEGISTVTEHQSFGISCRSIATDVDTFKAWLQSEYNAGTPVVVYYKLVTPTELTFTEAQKAVAKQIKETLHTYKNVTHIYSNDEISPIFDIQYVKDINVENDRLQKQIDEIKQLLSTTQTSAILLDNLQSDVESEVE